MHSSHLFSLRGTSGNSVTTYKKRSKTHIVSSETTFGTTQSFVKPFLSDICRRQFLSATLHSFVATSVKDLGTLTKLEVRHDGIPLITQWKLDWAVVKPAWGGDR